MKNYLFAPFEDDAEKIEEFNHFKNYLSSGHRNSLIMFIGRLESYYDNIIGGLKSENAVAVADERIINKLEDEITELKAEIEDLRKTLHKAVEYKSGLIRLEKENGELQAEIKQLRSDMAHDSEVCYDLDDKHTDIIKRLEEEVKESKEQYHMLASSKTSHYPKEYRKEADEYFHHNPQCKKLLFFLIDGSEFDWDEDNDGCNGMNGEYNGVLFADDCIAEFDN